MLINSAFALYQRVHRKYNNNYVDRMSQVYATNAFITFAFAFFFHILVERSIVCMLNGYEHYQWTSYIESYCAVESKYFVSPNQSPFPQSEARETGLYNYYPWVKFVFVAQSFFFLLPHLMWEYLNGKSGICIRSLSAGIANNRRNAQKIYDSKSRHHNFANFKEAIPAFLQALKCNSRGKTKILGIFSPLNYLSNLYLFYKFANLVNAVGQLLFLNHFLKLRYTFWGAQVLWDLWNGRNWKMTGHFPRYVFCDSPRRDAVTGKTSEGTSQCLLNHNYIYEMIFIAIWFYLVLLILVIIIDLVKQLIFIQSYRFRSNFIENLMIPHGINRKHKHFERFIKDVLGKDGITTLGIMHSNLCRYHISVFIMKLFNGKKVDEPSWSAAYEAAINSAWNVQMPADAELVNTKNLKLTRYDLQTLSGLQWLNDQVMNCYLQLLMNRSCLDESLPKIYVCSTFFHDALCTKGFKGVQSWTNKIDLFSFEMCIIPIHLPSHWTLGVIDFKEKKIKYFDSMQGKYDDVNSLLCTYINNESKDKKKTQFNFDNWKFVCCKNIPKQQNGSDCGLFVLKFAEYASRRADIDFDQRHMPYFRRRTTLELLRQQLMP